MRCLTIREPWCELILSGKKTVEVRKMRTHYRGWIILTCSKSSKTARAGHAFAIAELVDCVPGSTVARHEAQCDVPPEAWGWQLRSVTRIPLRPVRGQLGLWHPDESLRRLAVRARRP